ncbi:dormancy-associated protein homolog 4 isoform X2 [Morus notabilis]|uniref:dormancy-associated protein homolog 4 isoform X2 n=1 Tax=Morus notabilis TaxID=981085 RepID=UPI000CECF02E|nr:dormancy-associated protein homolog 4 isoform X2 [Morus notabilis]
MGFLHKLWDETLAGPMPDTGLSKLRKYNSFSGTRQAPSPAPATDPPQIAVTADCGHDHQVQVTRSITILRTNPNPLVRSLSVDVAGSEPDSPSSCSTPRTPVTPGTLAENNLKRPWTRTKSVGVSATERGSEQRR